MFKYIVLDNRTHDDAHDESFSVIRDCGPTGIDHIETFESQVVAEAFCAGMNTAERERVKQDEMRSKRLGVGEIIAKIYTAGFTLKEHALIISGVRRTIEDRTPDTNKRQEKILNEIEDLSDKVALFYE